MRGAIFFVLASATFISAQTVSPQNVSSFETDTSVARNASEPAARQMTVPAGTQVLLPLREVLSIPRPPKSATEFTAKQAFL